MNIDMRFRRKFALLALISISGPWPAFAEGEESYIEEIVVTATHRDTAMMDTPLTISTLTEDVMLDKGIINIQNLYQSIPGLAYRSNSSTYNTISVRGISPPGDGGATVGVYVDEVPVTDATSGSGNSQITGVLFDLERVEVLKGPQGTLFGEGNMGGAIRYITRSADPNEWDFKIRAQGSDYGEGDDTNSLMNAVVNIPLVENRLGLRVAGWYRDTGGYLDVSGDPADFRRNEDDVNWVEESGARAKLNWTVTDSFELSAMYNWAESEYGGPALASFAYGSDQEFNTAGFDNGGVDTQKQANITLNFQFSAMDLLFSSSYFDRDVEFAEETTPRFAGILQSSANAFVGLPAGLPPAEVLNPRAMVLGLGGDGSFARQSERYVQELRLLSNNESKWQWLAGLYFKDDESTNGVVGQHIQYVLRPEWEFLRPAIDGLYGTVFGLSGETVTETEEQAVYGEISYAFSDRWELAVGARVSNVEKTFSTVDLDIDDDMFSPKVTLTWRPREEWMLYGVYSQGFRPGVGNTQVINDINTIQAAAAAGMPVAGGQAWIDQYGNLATVDGDEVLNYELGVKGTLWDGRISLVGSVYFMEWDDTLTQESIPKVLPGLPTLQANVNAGEAESQGMEVEIIAVLTDSLTFTIGGDWNWEAEMKTGGSGQFADGAGNPVFIEPGNSLANAPKYSWNTSINYSHSLGSWQANVRADWYRVADMFNRATNELTTPGYHKLDLRYTAVSSEGNWRISAFVENLDDEEILYEVNEAGLRFGAPRTIGIELGYSLSGN